MSAGRWCRGAVTAQLLLLSACGTLWQEQGGVPTLGDLAALEPVVLGAPVPPAEVRQVEGLYRQALTTELDDQTRLQVRRRLAGLAMLQGEERQLAGEAGGEIYRDAIRQYEALLAEHPRREGNDELLYQIAKAHDLDGREQASLAALERLTRDHPQSPRAAEAWFRLGDRLFSQGDYAAAAQAFAEASSRGRGGPFYLQAVYLRGWSLFKQSRYREALAPFNELLERLLPTRGYGPLDAGALSAVRSGDREVVEDSLRAMSLAFSYLEGPVTIDRIYAEKGPRPYTPLLYRSLAAQYLDKQRFRDAADTYRHYLERQPYSPLAPDFAVAVVDAYRQGGFPSLVLPAKERYAMDYGTRSDYWAAADEEARRRIRPQLRSYLEALATHHHALAQQLQTQGAAAAPAAGTPAAGAPAAAAPAAGMPAAGMPVAGMPVSPGWREQYLMASDWYAQFAESFPEDEATPRLVFLKAESLYEAGDLPGAIAAYEEVAYGYRDGERGAQAGYAAILAYERQLAGLPEESRTSWQWRKIGSELRFAREYPDDEQAGPVLARAAEELLAGDHYSEAVEVGMGVTSRAPALAPDLRLTGWLVQGHGQFELGRFAAAEGAYQQALGLMPGDGDGRPALLDRLAASVFRQGEQALAAGDESAAVAHLRRVATVAPRSDLAARAQYDAATHLMRLGHWDQSEVVLLSMRRRYGEHPLAVDLPAKLGEVYLQQGEWAAAAEEYALLAAGDQDPEVRRQSLFLAAELYRKSGHQARAIAHFSNYAKQYPQPFQQLTEARYQLSELYLEAGDEGQRRVWLAALVEGHRDAGPRGTERSRYLAAAAAAVFADDAYEQFRRLALTQPLRRSLVLKKRAMEQALAAYREVLDFGVEEFASQASYYLGEVYLQLSRDLMASDRPETLDALALEQYEMMLEEQAYPFEERGIALHEANAARSWQGLYDRWVRASFDALATVLPARYAKQEKIVRYSHDIY